MEGRSPSLAPPGEGNVSLETVCREGLSITATGASTCMLVNSRLRVDDNHRIPLLNVSGTRTSSFCICHAHPSSVVGSLAHRSHPRTGFTLFELLLVVGIFSILLAMAWPAYDQMFAQRQLPEAANQLRTFLRDTRRQAMADGIVYRCDFVPETSRLRMVPASDPYEGESEEASATDSQSAAPPSSATGMGVGNGTEVFEPARVEEELSGGIQVIEEKKFEEGPKAKNSETKELENVEEQVETPTDGTSKDSSAKWVPIAVFYPDGSSAPATIRLIDKENHFVEIYVSALTGEVGIGEAQDWRSDEDVEKEEAEQNNEMEESK